MYCEEIQSPFGPVSAYANDIGLYKVVFGKLDSVAKANIVTHTAKFELQAYFERSLQKFTVALDFGSAGAFQKRVWKYLLSIPFGETRSYKDIALALGDVNSVRAVGNANGKNPLPIIVPCHRVIGSDKSLTGYAYGLEMKQNLLALENPKSFGIQSSLF